MFVVILICIVILFIVLITSQIYIKEHFLSLQYEVRNTPLTIVSTNYNTPSKVNELNTQNSIRFVLYDETKNIEYRNDSTLHVTDVFTYSKIQKESNQNLKLFTIIPTKKYFLFAQPLMFNKGPLLKTFFENNIHGKIKYFNDFDIDLIKILLPLVNMPLEKISKYNEIGKDDCIFMFFTIENTDVWLELKNMQTLEYIHDVDIKQIADKIPYIYPKTIVISDYLGNKKDSIVFYETLSIDLALYGTTDIEKNYKLTDCLNELNVKLDSFNLVNFYSFFFDFFIQTLYYIKMENDHIITQNNVPILQQ